MIKVTLPSDTNLAIFFGIVSPFSVGFLGDFRSFKYTSVRFSRRKKKYWWKFKRDFSRSSHDFSLILLTYLVKKIFYRTRLIPELNGSDTILKPCDLHGSRFHSSAKHCKWHLLRFLSRIYQDSSTTEFKYVPLYF